MQLTTGPPLLFALGLRILVNSVIFPSETPPSTSDFLLTGLFHGVLLYHTLTQLPHLVLPVAFGIAGWVLLDFLRAFDATKCACTLLGAALGVLITDVLDKFFENEEEPPPSGRERSSARDPAYEPSRRLRLVSFGRSGQDRHRTHGQPRRNGHAADELEREREREDRRSRRLEVRPLTPTLTYASTAPSISLESVPSSIDPEGKLSPHERAVAVLRARASLADSERRRFKEERKWALSQGNTARASQLAWQVKRYAALMESFHREADAKVIEAARAAGTAPPASPVSKRRSRSKLRQPSSSTAPHSPAQPTVQSSHPLVSVTVGTGQRRRKISAGSSGLRPAIRV